MEGAPRASVDGSGSRNRSLGEDGGGNVREMEMVPDVRATTTTQRKLGANGLPRRRNGKQQACEPCRKAKIACDHSLPVCDRCRKRKRDARCVYVDAPMTKSVEGGAVGVEGVFGTKMSPVPRARHVSAARRASQKKSTSKAAGIEEKIEDGNWDERSGMWSGMVVTAGERQRVERRDAEYGKPNPESGPFIKSGGFFGPTNFSAVFLENQENLGNEPLHISSDPSSSYVPSYESLQPQTFLMLSTCKAQSQGVSPRITLGANVLQALPNRASCQFLLDRYQTKTHCQSVFPKESVVATASSIWSTFPAAMKFPRPQADLEEASMVLCANAERALEEKESYRDWLGSVMGKNLRWEVVGQVYGALAGSILSLGERDPFFGTQEGERRDRRRFAVEMKECTQACVTLSNFVDLINLPMVALLVKNLVLQTVISGDACLVVWRQLGDLVFATTALGLHRQIDTEDQPVTFLSEMKRRLITSVLHFNLGSSLLMGRPPALSHRSTKFKLPHAISDEALMQGGEKIQEAIARLDVNGWDPSGELNPATTMKARGMMLPILSEILDLYLGDKEECTVERIDHLMSRITTTYASLPSCLQFRLSDLSHVPDIYFLKRLTLRLSVLEHRLLLERLAHKNGVLSGQSMVDCAREMLELTVLLWVQRDRFPEHHHDYDWMLMCWGVPSSGVLCVELLKEIKSKGATGAGMRGRGLRLPRSEIVQNLSLLIGFLDWIKPAAGNYQLCLRMRVIIKRILDQILNPGPQNSNAVAESYLRESGAGPVAEAGGEEMGQEGMEGQNGTGLAQTHTVVHGGMQIGQTHGGYDPALFDGGAYGYGFVGEVDNFDWLNNVDWSRGPWIDLGQDVVSGVKWI